MSIIALPHVVRSISSGFANTATIEPQEKPDYSIREVIYAYGMQLFVRLFRIPCHHPLW